MLAVCDGKNLYFLVRPLNQYRKHPAPSSMAEVTRVEPLFRTIMDPPAFLRGEDPLKNAKNLKVVGSETVSGQPVHHLRFDATPPQRPPAGQDSPKVSMSVTVDLWIGKRDSLLYKMQTTTKVSRGEQSMSSIATETHTQMKVNHSVADSAFNFIPPKGAKEVKEFLRPTLPGAPSGRSPSAPPKQ